MDQELTFRASRWKALLLVAGSALFVAGGFFMAKEKPFIGWACVLFFGAGVVLGLLLLVTGGAKLRVHAQGFEMTGLFNTSSFRWADIEAIRLAKIRGASVIAIDYRKESGRRSQVSRSMAGMDASIGNLYNVSLKDLCATLDQWHRRHGARAVDSGPLRSS